MYTTTESTVSTNGGYIDHVITYAADYDEKMDALCVTTSKLKCEAKREYYENSSFSILSHKTGCYVLNNMTGYICNVDALSWDAALSRRKSELSGRGMKY